MYTYDDSQSSEQDKIGIVQHIVAKTIDTRPVLLDNVTFDPVGGGGNVSLSPSTFDPKTMEYSGTLPYGVETLASAITLPETAPAGTTLELQVNGGGYAIADPDAGLEQIPLQVGRNTIEYKITNPYSGESKVYTFTIDIFGNL